MSYYGITAVRIGKEKYVTHVKWGEVDGSNNTWKIAPHDAEVDDVVAAILNGDSVNFLPPVPGGAVSGPKALRIVLAGGIESIKMEDSDHYSLDDIPRF